ncbi:MAG: ABC transporter substrate-binding protein [Flavobacteriaceae bacterium]
MLCLSIIACAPAKAEPAQRIVSLNLCADLLLVDLVPPSRIAALSRNARNPSLNPEPEKMAGFTLTGRTAEEALALDPDLVLAGAFAGRDAKAFLRGQGIPVVEVGIADTVEGIASVIRQTGEALGAPERAAVLIAAMERPAPPPGERPKALNLQRRGFVAGRNTLMDDLMRRAGLENAAPFEGYRQFDAEGLMQLDADIIVLSKAPGAPTDQGEALLQHPALQAHFGEALNVVVPGNLTVCAGPHVARAVDILRGARAAFLTSGR